MSEYFWHWNCFLFLMSVSIVLACCTNKIQSPLRATTDTRWILLVANDELRDSKRDNVYLMSCNYILFISKVYFTSYYIPDHIMAVLYLLCGGLGLSTLLVSPKEEVQAACCDSGCGCFCEHEQNFSSFIIPHIHCLSTQCSYILYWVVDLIIFWIIWKFSCWYIT